MKTVLYSNIRCAEGQVVTDIFRRAHALGYELVQFNGWDNDDLGASGMPGPRRADADRNMEMIQEIQDACEVVIDGSADWPHITHTVSEK